MPHLKPFLSVDEFAAIVGVSTRTIGRRLADGTIRRAPLGGRVVRIPISELHRLTGASHLLEGGVGAAGGTDDAEPTERLSNTPQISEK